MKISIIIVSYNVKYFLEQCIFSVQAALKNVPGEIIVVDNASIDKTIEYLRPGFPLVKFIANSRNCGFSAGCNQGFKLSSGEFVLFLNPDCIIPEDCLEKCISFLTTHPEAGAIGVKMLDGSGQFLKESKRAFPSLSTSLFKLIGLAGLFPHSKLFARYYAGHLDENKNHETDVLAGAFMMMKRHIFEKVNGFDEDFFMYGEDIDLSYRIQKAGFKNYYYSDTEIIHFKGESTKKGELNYVQMFYKAMRIFINKHYKGSKAGLYKFFIRAGIGVAAQFSLVKNLITGVLHSGNTTKSQFVAIVGTEEEFQSAVSLLERTQPGKQVVGRIALDETDKKAIGYINDVAGISQQHSFHELVFCAGTLSFKKIIQLIQSLPEDFEIKVHAAGSNSMAGSPSKDKKGDAIGIE